MDPYVYPGTNVLRNLRDIREPERLASFEAAATARRLKELESDPLRGSFDAEHLQAVHEYIFQDVYAWAGRFRTVNIAKSGQFYFAFANRIEPSIAKLLGRLRLEKLLEGLAVQDFSIRAGHYLGELNAIHPFREGNGRSQREIIRELALRNGYVLNWSRAAPEQVREASRRSFQHGDNGGMMELIRIALRDERPPR